MDNEAIIALALQQLGIDHPDAAKTISNYLKIASVVSGGGETSNIPRSPSPKVVPIQPPTPRYVVEEEAPTRIIQGATAKGDTQYHTVEDIANYLKRNAPPFMDVDLNDGKAPVKLQRDIKQIQFAIGSGGQVKLRYHQRGEEEAPTELFNTGDPELDLDRKLENIYRAAQGMYSRKQREVRPAMPKPVSFNPDQLEGGMGGDADEARMDERAASFFQSAPVTPKEAAARAGEDPRLWNH